VLSLEHTIPGGTSVVSPPLPVVRHIVAWNGCEALQAKKAVGTRPTDVLEKYTQFSLFRAANMLEYPNAPSPCTKSPVATARHVICITTRSDSFLVC
jgi:hypothetical protein